MSISLRSDSSGTYGAIQVGGADKLLINQDASMTVPAVTGAFRNLQASATGLSASVSVSVDELVVSNSSNAYLTLRAVSLSINAASSGANGLDSGSLSSSTWYAVWVIWNGSTVSGLLSLSATAPTLPSGYTHKARVGWMRTDATANKYPLSFVQIGRKVRYRIGTGTNVTNRPIIASGSQGDITTPTWVACAVAAFVPTTAAVISLVLEAFNSTTIAAPNNSYAGYSGGTNKPPLIHSYSSGATTGTSVQGDLLLESPNIYYAANNANCALMCQGWEDNL